MARPRKDQEGPSALERMRSAFWQLLEERPYSSITVKLVTGYAGVNHNTFYYHFDNIDDMAMSLLYDNMPEELTRAIVSMVSGKGIDIAQASKIPDMAKRFHRVRLILRNGSPDFVKKVRGQIAEAWIGMLGVTREDVKPPDWAKFNFIWGGVTSLMASEEVETFEDYCTYLQDGIADCIGQLAYLVGEGHGVGAAQK